MKKRNNYLISKIIEMIFYKSAIKTNQTNSNLAPKEICG